MNNIFDFAESVNKSSRICTREIFEATLKLPHVSTTCSQIKHMMCTLTAESTQDDWRRLKDAIAPLKKQLPVLIPHSHSLTGNRKGEESVPSALVSLDIDELLDPNAFWQEKVKPLSAQLHLCLAYISPSYHGLKLVAVRPAGMSLKQAQEWMAQQIGTEFDGQTYDLARCSFMVPQSWILLYEPEVLFDTELEPYANPMSQVETETAEPTQSEAQVPATIPYYKGVSMASLVSGLFEKLGCPGGPQPGERNNVLFQVVQQLAALDSDKQILRSIIPSCGLSESEYESILSQGVQYRFRKISSELQQVIREKQAEQTGTEGEQTGIQPVKIPSVLPKAARLMLKGVPEYLQPAVLAVSEPVTSTLGTHIRVMGPDGRVNGVTSHAVLCGPFASGKDVIRDIHERLTRPIQATEEANRQAEAEWQDAKDAAINSKQQPAKPHLPIRLLTPNTSKTKLLERMRDAKGEHCLIYTAELEEMVNNNALSYGKLEPIIRLSFDGDGGLVGNDTCSAQSANLVVKSRLNLMAAGTFDAVNKFFKNHSGGTSSRVLFVQLEDRLGMERPCFIPRTASEEAELDRLLQLLVDEPEPEKPFVLKKTIKALEEWQAGLREEYNHNQSDPAKLKASYRAYTIGLRAAAKMFVMEGKRETQGVINYGLYIAQLAHAGFYTMYADKLNSPDSGKLQRDENARQYQQPTVDLLMSLPVRFSRQDLIDMRAKLGYTNAASHRNVLKRWRDRGYIQPVEGDPNMFIRVAS